jgi:hypothetical protein
LTCGAGQLVNGELGASFLQLLQQTAPAVAQNRAIAQAAATAHNGVLVAHTRNTNSSANNRK